MLPVTEYQPIAQANPALVSRHAGKSASYFRIVTNKKGTGEELPPVLAVNGLVRRIFYILFAGETPCRYPQLSIK